MAILLFRLRNVPADEAGEVRELLLENGIAYYETSAGNWRISMPALWLKDDSQLPEARELLDRYQRERRDRIRREYEERKLAGEQQTLWKNFVHNPVKVLFSLGAALLVLYLSLQAYLTLG